MTNKNETYADNGTIGGSGQNFSSLLIEFPFSITPLMLQELPELTKATGKQIYLSHNRVSNGDIPTLDNERCQKQRTLPPCPAAKEWRYPYFRVSSSYPSTAVNYRSLSLYNSLTMANELQPFKLLFRLP
jgi:hypothetical protein